MGEKLSAVVPHQSWVWVTERGFIFFYMFWVLIVHCVLLSIPVLTTSWAWSLTNVLHSVVRPPPHSDPLQGPSTRVIDPLLSPIFPRGSPPGMISPLPSFHTFDSRMRLIIPRLQITYLLFHHIKGAPVETMDEHSSAKTQWEQV